MRYGGEVKIKPPSFYLLLVLTALCSCSTFPADYKEPAINVPSELQDTTNNAGLSKLPYLAWWQKFDDTALNQLIQQAVQNNNDLQIAQKNIDIAQAQLDTIELGWIPGINIYAGFSQNPILTNPGVFAFIQPSYITNLFTTYYQQKQAKYNLQQVKDLELGVKLTVISQVTAGYFSLLAWQDRLQILHNKQQNYQKLIDITEKAQSLGLANSLQVTALQSQLKQIAGDINNVEKNIVTSNNAIRFLINQNPGSINTDKTFNQINAETLVYGKINVKVIANRPDVMAAFQNIEAASTGINVSASQLLPSVDIDEYAGVASLNGSISAPNKTANFGDTYGVLNISPQTFGSINASREIFRAQVINYNKIIQNALREISNGIDANSKLTSKYHNDSDALQAMVKNDDLQLVKFNQGLVSKMTLINSQISVNDLQLLQNSSKLEQLISVVILYQQLAGGYEYASNKK